MKLSSTMKCACGTLRNALLHSGKATASYFPEGKYFIKDVSIVNTKRQKALKALATAGAFLFVVRMQIIFQPWHALALFFCRIKEKQRKGVEKMENNYQNEEILDGQNRCRRCDRPLINSNDIYGWRCAKIVGLDTYNKIATTLDEDALFLYNRYVAKHMAKDGDKNFTMQGKNYKKTFKYSHF